MNRRALVTIAFVVMLMAGIGIGRLSVSPRDSAPTGTASAGREILYWVAPMDPGYRRDAPGKSPMGMDLVPVYADEVDAQAGAVSIDPSVVNQLGVRTATAERGDLPRRIDTVGYVAYDENTLQHVHTRVDGWIETLATKSSGDPVVKGQLLFELYSPTLVNAQEEYLAALRSSNAALLRASADRLAALGVTDSEVARLAKERSVNQRVRVYAEADGVVTHLGVREGIFVTPATEVMSVASLEQVWVLAEVFERQAVWANAGQHATVTLDYLPGRVWHGTVDYVYPELDAQTRTLKVRLQFANEDRILRPNMFGKVSIDGSPAIDVVHVPRAALIRGGETDRVVIALGEGRFLARVVEAGIESGDRVAILSGLDAGQQVVVSGQFLIDSESNVDAALSRLQEGDDARTGADDNKDHNRDHNRDHQDHETEQPR